MADHTSQVGTQLSTVRDRIGATAEELGHRANLPERAKGAIRDRAERISDGLQENGGQGGSAVKPLAIALGSAAAGFLVGALLPSTDMERQKMGGMAGEVRAAAADTAHEALERGKDVLGEAAEVTRTRAAEEGQQVTEHAREQMDAAVHGERRA